MNNRNILLMTDSYKASHAYQYPPGTDYVYSYIESRGGIYDKTVFFGLQMFLKEYLSKPITKADVDEAEEFWSAHGEPFYRAGWDYIVEKKDGNLPISIAAVGEGHVVETKNVLVTLINTDPKCWWLTSFLETAILRAVWYPTTVCTISYMAKQIIKKALEESSDDQSQVYFKLHDFGARGVSSAESAAIGGAAHLVNFRGSDTVEGVLAAKRYYHAPMAGFSIPAAEHSTITSWGRNHEVDAYRNMIRRFKKPGGLIAVVSDSYDIMNAVSNIWGGVLREEVINSGATIVVRPDSGNPITTPVDVIEALGEKFSYFINSKGYKVLPSYVRAIQGDGITIETLPLILAELLRRGWAADNLTFGMGGGLLQQVNRDTFKFAMKCSAIMVDGVWREVFKDPITDPGKVSKKGLLALKNVNGKFITVPRAGNASLCWLRDVFVNGTVENDYDFEEVRANSEVIRTTNEELL